MNSMGIGNANGKGEFLKKCDLISLVYPYEILRLRIEGENEVERKATETKMVIVVRKDLCMTKGKYVAQGSHASLGLVLDMQSSDDECLHAILEKWFSESSTKICVYVRSLEELHEIKNRALENGEAVKLITDSGLTMFNGEKTDTCLAILGYRNSVDEITGHLQLL